MSRWRRISHRDGLRISYGIGRRLAAAMKADMLRRRGSACAWCPSRCSGCVAAPPIPRLGWRWRTFTHTGRRDS